MLQIACGDKTGDAAGQVGQHKDGHAGKAHHVFPTGKGFRQDSMLGKEKAVCPEHGFRTPRAATGKGEESGGIQAVSHDIRHFRQAGGA
jgi:hypothetical protein